jgi:hypothetical protein
MIPNGWEGPQEEKQFLHDYIGNNHLTNFNQTWYKPFLHEGNSSLFKLRGNSSSKGDNHKSTKIGWVIYIIYILLLNNSTKKSHIYIIAS